MKVLLVTFEFPPQKGGMENYYYNLIKHQPDVEFVVLTNSQKEAKEFDVQQKFKVIRKKLLSNIIWPRWIKLYFLIKKTIKKEKIDMVWVGDVLPVGSAVYFLKQFYKIKYFVSTHGMDIMLPQRSLRKENLMKKILKQAEFITANSQFTKNELLNLNFPDEKINVIYPCPNLLQVKNQELNDQVKRIKSDLNLQGKKVLLTVGRLVKRKGQDMVMKSVEQLLKKIPNLVYLIVGDGPEKGNLELRIKDLGLEDKIMIIDDVLDEDLPVYYQLSDLFVMPARNIKGDVEGFGIVYLEANMFGLPVVAGKSGGTHEAVIDGQTGILVNPESVSDISQKIYELLTNQKLYHQFSKAGQERVEREFNWEVQANLLLKLLCQNSKK